MDPRPDFIDEYTIAAFLAGTLPEARRAEVAAYLADNPDAAELLCMAQDALAAARQDEPLDAAPRRTDDRPARKSVADRGPAERRRLRWPRYVGAAVLVVVLGIGLRLGFGTLDDALRNRPDPDGKELVVQMDRLSDGVRWTPVDDAYYYRIVVWDPDYAQIVGQHETRTTSLASDDPFLLSLRPHLDAGRAYTLRVDAIDAQNRLVRSSRLTDFRAP